MESSRGSRRREPEEPPPGTARERATPPDDGGGRGSFTRPQDTMQPADEVEEPRSPDLHWGPSTGVRKVDRERSPGVEEEPGG